MVVYCTYLRLAVCTTVPEISQRVNTLYLCCSHLLTLFSENKIPKSQNVTTPLWIPWTGHVSRTPRTWHRGEWFLGGVTPCDFGDWSSWRKPRRVFVWGQKVRWKPMKLTRYGFQQPPRNTWFIFNTNKFSLLSEIIYRMEMKMVICTSGVPSILGLISLNHT